MLAADATFKGELELVRIQKRQTILSGCCMWCVHVLGVCCTW